MNYKKILCYLSISAILIATACDNSDSSIDESSTESSVSESISESAVVTGDVSFKNGAFIYDGTEKSISVTNLPAGATVTYTNNNKVEPGKYSVTANVTFADGTTKKLTANLTIKKGNSTLEVADNQTVSTAEAIPAYSLSNSEQTVVCTPLYKAGTYSVELYAEATDHYYESNHVTVTLNVKDYNPSNVVFESKTVKYTGSPIYLTATNIDSNYHVEYVNNVATNQGSYNAICKVLNSKNEVVSIHRAILTIDNENNPDFDEYMDDLFTEYLSGDYYAINIFLEHPENYGLSIAGGNAKWYTYTTITAQDKKDTYDYYKGFMDELETFKDASLSYSQQISYRRAHEFFDYYVKFYNPDNNYDFLMSQEYIDQFGGYPSSFASCMEAYELRCNEDIENVLSLIKSLPTAYASYITYGNDRIAAGYALSDYTIDEMIDYVSEIVDDGTDYYLIEVLKNKIDNTSFLSAEGKTEYKEKIDDYFEDYFIPANTDLAEDLTTLKGHCTQEGYLSTYQYGKEQYLLELESLLGLEDFDPAAYEQELKSGMSKYFNLYYDVYKEESSNPLTSAEQSEYNELSNGTKSIIGKEEPLDQLEFLKEFAKELVPELDNQPAIEVKNMDLASADKSNAVAYYMKSALDSTSAEHITLNPLKLQGNYNDCLSTLAHEGYPGHLYAYLYSKSLDISNYAKLDTSTAHAEGWATYVQYRLYDYLIDNNTCNYQKAVKYYCLEEKYWGVFAYLLYTYLDFGIHYYGWDVEQVAKAMTRQNVNNSGAEEIYKTLIEMPSEYASYGYGQLVMLRLHDEASEKLGYYYDEKELNQVILSHGWCSLSELEDIVDEYVEDTLYIYQSPIK